MARRVGESTGIEPIIQELGSCVLPVNYDVTRSLS